MDITGLSGKVCALRCYACRSLENKGCADGTFDPSGLDIDDNCKCCKVSIIRKIRGYAYDKIKYVRIRTYLKKYAYYTRMIRVLNVPELSESESSSVSTLVTKVTQTMYEV